MIAQIRNLTLRIPTRVGGRSAFVHAATDVCVDLAPGRVHALVGESGSGKSVLASVLTGLLPPRTSVQGSVIVDGRDLGPALGHSRHRAWDAVRGRIVGSVAQSAATAFTHSRTIRGQLAEAIAHLEGPVDADGLAALAHLPTWALDAYPHELSGGLIGRAALAASLAGDPAIIVADEPTASLDRDLTAHVLGLLRTRADTGAAVLLITHDVAALLDGAERTPPLIDDVSVMYAGRIVEQAPADEVWRCPRHPYTQALLAALPRNGLHTVPGDPPALTNLDDAVRFEDRLALR